MVASSENLADGYMSDINTLSYVEDGIYVCPLAAVDDMISAVGASHLVTLINKDTMIETPGPLASDNHLRLAMNDIVEPQPELVLPNEDHVRELIDFADEWDQSAPMLIHCWAGISRSTAAAFVTMCRLNPDVDEILMAQHMRSLSPTLYPNRKIVEHGDNLLGRKGKMLQAVDSLGRGEMAMEGVIFGVSSNFPK